jgi:hypothetical protein
VLKIASDSCCIAA